MGVRDHGIWDPGMGVMGVFVDSNHCNNDDGDWGAGRRWRTSASLPTLG